MSILLIYRPIPLIALLLFWSAGHSQTYQDVAFQKNVRVLHSFPSGFSSGVSCVDFDGDGLDDISLASQSGDSLWFYKNTGLAFTKIPAPVNHTAYSTHIIWVDYDNDGDKDLYVSSLDVSNKLYRNDSTAGFTDVTTSSGLTTPSQHSYGASWGDYNNDGWLDLYQCNRNASNYLFLSDGTGGFSNTSINSGTASHNRTAFAPVFFDFNKDGHQDLFVANDKQLHATELYKNNGDSTFTEVSSSAGVDFNMDAMSATVGDYNNDGYLDIYVTNTPGGNKLLRNNQDGTFTELADSLGVAFYRLTWAASFLDYNNDGLTDLYVSEQYQNPPLGNQSLFENTGQGFIHPAAGLAGDTLKSFSHALGDFNNDGHYDIVSPNQNPDSLQLWESSGGSGNWIKLRLEGTVSNRDGIGTWITAYADSMVCARYTTCGSGYLTQNSTTKIIGLGSKTSVDSLEVKWLSGHTDKYYMLSTGQTYHLKEGSGINLQVVRTGDSLFCEGDSINVQLQPSKAYASYQWSTGDTTSSITVHSPGDYYLKVTNEFGLTDSSESISIRVDSIDLQAFVKHDSSGTSTGSARISVTGGIPPFAFGWDDPASQTDSVAVQLAQGTYTVVVTDSIGCSDSLSVLIENSLSLDEDLPPDVNLFPNPAFDHVHIEGLATKPLHFKLVSSNGFIFQEGLLSSPHQLSLKDVPPGLYQLILAPRGEGVTSKKLVIAPR